MGYLPDEPRRDPLNPDADAEMLWRVLDSVKKADSDNRGDNPEWNQGNWADGEVALTDNENANWCGTSFCYAGWTAFLDDSVKIIINRLRPDGQTEYGNITDCVVINREGGENLNITDMSLNDYSTYQHSRFQITCIVDGGKLKPIDTDEYPYAMNISLWAQERLGLTEQESDVLFHASNRLQDLEEIVRVITGYTEPLNYAIIEKWKTYTENSYVVY